MKRIGSGIMAALLLAGALTGCSGTNGQAEVTVAVAKPGKNLSDMVWQGTVEPLSRIDVMPNGSGRVTGILVQEADHVNAGDVLFQVDSEDYELQLEQAKANCQSAQAAFDNAVKTSEGNTVVRPAEIAYTTARDHFNRIQVLFNDGSVSQADYEAAKAQMDSAAVQLEAARNSQDSGYESAKAQLDSARAALDIIQKKYDDCSVTSPVSGLVTDIRLEAGQMVSPQVKALTVMDDSGKKIKIKVADLDINYLPVGARMNVSLQTLGEVWQGTVSEVSAVSDQTTGMFTVTVSLQDGCSNSGIGLIADLRLHDEAENTSVYVPAKSIETDETGSYVFKVADGKAVKTAVTPGKKKNAYIEIKDGIKAGEDIIIQSSNPLEDGKAVNILIVK